MRFLLMILVLLVATPTSAQEASSYSTTVEAQSLFAAGQAAYDDARYEDALRYFRLASEVSDLPELQYNIGLSADRLRRDAEALEAFDAFLRGVDEDHSKYNEVQARVRVLRGLDLRVHEIPSGDEPEPRSKTGLIVGLSVAGVLVVVGVVLVIVLTGGSGEPTPGTFGPTFQALSSP